jgi:tetratricopeptide (TPR) repeat protein
LSWKKRKWLFFPAVAVFLLAAAVFMIPRLFPPRLLPIPPNKPSLAIVQFENTTGDERFDPWKTALPDLIITDLVQSRYVTVVRITDLYRRLRDLKLTEAEKFSSEDLKKIADKNIVSYVATGQIGKAARDIAISVTLQNPKTGEILKSAGARFQNESHIFAAVDELTEKIKISLNLTPRYVSYDIDDEVSHISTRSPQAFILFSQGYRMFAIQRYQEGISLLQKAVEIDPGFSLAYKYLFRACYNARREADSKKYAQKAVDLSGRLSERERGELEFLYYDDYQKNPTKKNAALERLCRFYPDDRFGSVNLLGSYLRLEVWDKALPIAQNAWTTNKTDASLCQQLAICYANTGRIDKAQGVLDEFISSNPGHQFLSSVLRLRFWCYVRQNKLNAALKEVNGLISEYPKVLSYVQDKGIVYLHQNDFSSAETEFRKSFEQGNIPERLDALLFLSELFLTQGKIDEAKKQLDAGLEISGRLKIDPAKDRTIDTKIRFLHLELANLYRLLRQWPEALKEVEEAFRDIEKVHGPGSGLEQFRPLKALITLDLGRWEEFDRQVEEIKQIIEREQQPKLMRIYYHLLGQKELQKKNFKAAVDYFWKALDLVSVPGNLLNEADPVYFYSLAEAYAQMEPPIGMSSRALSMYEKVTQPALNRLSSGDLYARSFFMMAKYYDAGAAEKSMTADQMKSFRAKSIENYRKFLGLWGHADALFAAEVEEAKKRLADLELE